MFQSGIVETAMV